MKSHAKAALTVLKWAALTLAGVALFFVAKADAYAVRGYAAHGGEYLLLPLPLWWWLIERCVGDFIRDIKAELAPLNKNGGNHDA